MRRLEDLIIVWRDLRREGIQQILEGKLMLRISKQIGGCSTHLLNDSIESMLLFGMITVWREKPRIYQIVDVVEGI